VAIAKGQLLHIPGQAVEDRAFLAVDIKTVTFFRDKTALKSFAAFRSNTKQGPLNYQFLCVSHIILSGPMNGIVNKNNTVRTSFLIHLSKTVYFFLAE
jgi:hypothetical protein